MHLIGLTGTHGAGKGTVTEILARGYGFAVYSVSEFLASEALRRGMQPDRAARRDIANELRRLSPTALMEAVYATLPEGVERVVIEPQYTLEEVRCIQGKGGIVLALDAPLEMRYARIQVRGSTKDIVSFEEFRRSQELEMRSKDGDRQNLTAAMAAADVWLKNDGTREELERVVCAALETYGLRCT